MATGRLRDSNRDIAGDFIGECSVTQSCEPCMKINVSTTATVFCQDCDEFLCDACKNPHIVYKAGKHDIVKCQNKISVPVGVDMKGIDMCGEHDKEIEFFCQDHSKLCCSKCAFTHRKCDQMDEIATVLGDKRPELQVFEQSLIKLQSEADALIADCKHSESGLNDSIAIISSEVDAMKDRIIKLFEDAKQKVLSEAKQFKTSEVRRITNKLDASSNVKKEMLNELSMCCAVLERGTPTQKYIYSTHIKEKLNTMESNLNKQQTIIISSIMTVSFPKEITTLLEVGNNFIKLNCDGNMTGLSPRDGGGRVFDDLGGGRGGRAVFGDIGGRGEEFRGGTGRGRIIGDRGGGGDSARGFEDRGGRGVETSSIIIPSQPRPLSLELLVSVDLHKTGDDEREPKLSGLDFLSDGRLVAVDNKNMKCIILNERLQRLGTPYTFKAHPHSLVCVSHDALCVTFAGSVCFLSVSADNTIRLTREMITSFKLDSICCITPSQMVVSTYENFLHARKLSVDGVESDFEQVVFPNKTYKYGENKCTYVQSMNTLVLTDKFAHTVYVYDTMKFTSRVFTNENIQEPRGCCVGPGDTVLVCSNKKNSIVHLSVDGDLICTYPVDMKYPEYICVSKDGTRMAMSNNAIGVKKLHLYKLSAAMS